MMDLVMGNKMALVATGPCLSACSIIASGAAKVVVQPGAYLGFHWNAESNPAQLLGLANWNQIPKIEAFIKKERQINESLGVSQKLYEDAWRLVNLRQDEHTALLGGPVWLPTLKELKCYGYRVDEFWFPQNGDMNQISFINRIGLDVFTTDMIRTKTPGLSECVGQQ
ncbi:hypothetical protein SU48_13520 [Deinococcus puniceus]|uniref:Uncharacterized protein n=2 Tax=Deinococcus puniceus TaxID=1182568 RepID=A0A172TC95_9DEIO|nr:hypothetical protein SU48_13520 [Deinococcus puniceus]